VVVRIVLAAMTHGKGWLVENWYHAEGGQTQGPFSFGELQALFRAGTITGASQVCLENGEWKSASEVIGLGADAAGMQAIGLAYQAPAMTEGRLTVRMAELLGQTSRFVRIFSILMFVGSGFMVLGGCLMGIMSFANVAGGPAREGAVLGAFMAVAYMGMAMLYIVPAIFLFRYGRYASAFGKMHDEKNMEDALQAQKSFWKFVTITVLVVISLYLLLLVGVMAVAIFSKFR
jgi:hypothetical protein